MTLLRHYSQGAAATRRLAFAPQRARVLSTSVMRLASDDVEESVTGLFGPHESGEIFPRRQVRAGLAARPVLVGRMVGTVQRVAWCALLMNTGLACHEVGRYRVVDLSPDAADPLGYSSESSDSTAESVSSPRLGGGGRTGRNFGAAAPSTAASDAGADAMTAVEAPLSTGEALEDVATSGGVKTVVVIVTPLDTETTAGSTDPLGTGAPTTGVLDTGTSSTTGNSPTTAGSTDTAIGTSTSTTPSLVTEPVVPDDTPACDIDAGADCAPDAQAINWCQADAECGDDAPFCVGEVCVECEVDEDCAGRAASVCDVGPGVCVD